MEITAENLNIISGKHNQHFSDILKLCKQEAEKGLYKATIPLFDYEFDLQCYKDKFEELGFIITYKEEKILPNKTQKFMIVSW